MRSGASEIVSRRVRRILTALLAAMLATAAVISGAARAIRAAAPATSTPPVATSTPLVATTSTDTTTTAATTTTDTTTTGPTITTAPPPSTPVAVRVNRTEIGQPIARGFLGLSFEYQAIQDYTGLNPHSINPVLVQLIRNLTPGQSPVLRVGGNSADQTWWPTPGVTRSPGIKYTLGRNWLATMRALAQATGGKLILDLNLKLDSAAEIAAEARAFNADIGPGYIDALEIGNEPELYPITPFYYRGPANTPVYPRRRSYHFPAYAREMSVFAKPLQGTPLAGPATGSLAYLSRLKKLFTVEPGLKIITYHRYPLIKCFTQPGDPGYPTIPNLLSAVASRDLLQGTGNIIALAHRHHATFRVDELNSVACKGQLGVSDTFASALWMLDTLFAMARSGVDGVNIHTLDAAVYHPFTFARVQNRWSATVFPEYYGMLLFAQAAPPGSRILSAAAAPGYPDIRVRATLTPAGVIHVVLINDSLTTGQVVSLQPPAGAADHATLERLNASGGAAATDGVTLAGQSFATPTTTGTLSGPFTAAHLAPVDGQYVINLPAASAAMLSFAATPS